MPEFYPSIGDAVGAAMAHNIRLAHGEPTGPDAPLQVRYLPHPSAEPYSVPGMIARLTETATPQEVAGILEEINGALVGALPQLSELVAAAADWTRLRLTFLGEPHRELVFETWTRLAAARGLLREVEENLEAAQNLVTAIPGDLRDPRCLDEIPALRTLDLLQDVLGSNDAAPDDEPRAASDPAADRQRAARSSSPHASAHRTAASGTAPTGPPAPPPASPPRSR
ncbi:hypothetical protein [Streptomyces sp. NBC_01190]|uniref:hypothetical protein n=1 Tax=Streptomyces sp. NBC_01190 TaxID=2903767 RepID=UPI00386F5C93|nr:hypothetical protein OG519_28725 [Streptomyces sp. NBC_01190]